MATKMDDPDNFVVLVPSYTNVTQIAIWETLSPFFPKSQVHITQYQRKLWGKRRICPFMILVKIL